MLVNPTHSCTRKSLLFLCLSVASVAALVPVTSHATYQSSDYYIYNPQEDSYGSSIIRGQEQVSDNYGEGRGFKYVGTALEVETVDFSMCKNSDTGYDMYVYILDDTQAIIATSTPVNVDDLTDCTNYASSTPTLNTMLNDGQQFVFSPAQTLLENYRLIAASEPGLTVSTDANFFLATTTGTDNIAETACYFTSSPLASCMDIFDVPFYALNMDNVSSADLTCDTCTRIIDSTPALNDTITATSTLQPFLIDYYVNLDDFDASSTYIKFFYKHSLVSPYPNEITPFNLAQETFIDTVVITDDETVSLGNMTKLLYEGTYYATIEIYKTSTSTLTNSWWNPFDNETVVSTQTLDTKSFYFDVGSSTTHEQQQEAQFYQNTMLGTVNDIDDSWWTKASLVADHMLRVPPLGYAVRIYDILSATTSTTSSSFVLNYTFASTSPVIAGQSVSFDTGQGLRNGWLSINESTREMFMLYWTYFWYILLAIKILTDVFGASTGEYNSEPYQKTGTIHSGVNTKQQRQFRTNATINMRK